MTNIPDNVPEMIRREYLLVKDALESEDGMKRLRKNIEPLVDKIAGRYSTKYRVAKEDLADVVWEHFEWAVGRYWENINQAIELGEEKYRFSTYFTHIISNSIQDYLGISNRESEL